MGTPEAAGPGPDRDGGGAAPRPQAPPAMPPVPAGALAHGRAAALRCVGGHPPTKMPTPNRHPQKGESTPDWELTRVDGPRRRALNDLKPVGPVLRQGAAFLEERYLGSADRDRCLEQTKLYAARSVGSVTEHIVNIARRIDSMLDTQDQNIVDIGQQVEGIAARVRAARAQLLQGAYDSQSAPVPQLDKGELRREDTEEVAGPPGGEVDPGLETSIHREVFDFGLLRGFGISLERPAETRGRSRAVGGGQGRRTVPSS